MSRLLPHLLLVTALWLALGWGVQPARAADLATFEVVARDGRLFPEKLEVPAGVKIKLSLKNESAAAVEFESQELRIEKVLAPNAASFVVIHPLKPGTYQFVDEFRPATGKMQVIAK